jgi:hypothetical protein
MASVRQFVNDTRRYLAPADGDRTRQLRNPLQTPRFVTNINEGAENYNMEQRTC